MAGPAPARIPGIHHISAICGDPQRNVDFYTGLLGLRLVKRTVNFDDPDSYHLYYGDGLGSPGTIMTFFAWILPPMASGGGRRGIGQITSVAFAVPAGSLDFWIDRVVAAGADFEGPTTRFGETVVSLLDPDGMALELVERPAATQRVPWHGSTVPSEHAIRGFAGATISLAGHERTAALLTDTLGFERIADEGSHCRFRVGDGDDAATIDLQCQPEREPGLMGVGVVHHIAWRARTAEEQQAWRDVLSAAWLDVTPVLDRSYFTSIYFRAPGGVVFEIATDTPGFTVDEPPEELGTQLKLPAWLEDRRERFLARLPELSVRRPPGAVR